MKTGRLRGRGPLPSSVARGRSFTLLELMVATSVLCLLCLLLLSLVDHASRTWRDQDAKQEGIREASAALTILSRDVGNAVVSSNANWFYSDTNHLAFLASLPQDAQAPGLDTGDICVVGYSLEWGRANLDDPGEKNRMSLYRYIRFSKPTYSTVLRAPASVQSVQSVFTSPDGTNTVRELLARNISRFSFTLYSTNGTGQPVAYAKTAAFPDIFDLSVSTLNEMTAAKLVTQQEWQNTNSTLIRQNERTFSLRVRSSRP